MAPSTFILTQALAIGAAAVALAPRAATTTFQDPYCSQISRYATNFPTQSSAASSYCTSYFHVTTSTSTTTQVITSKATATATSTSTITTTPTSTVVTGSQTCFQNTAVASPAMKKRGTPQQSQQSQAQAAASSQASSYISSACSCFGVNLAPKTTATAFTTTTQFVATSTAVVTSTSTAPAVTTSVESTSYYTPSGTYTSPDGGVYTEYDGFDFYGNDIVSGLCDGSSGGYVNTNVGSFACSGFESCEDVCSEYNNANTAQGAGQPQCKGVTYSISNTFCYLKSAVPGNGSANCQAMMNANTDSGILNAAPGTH